METNEDTTKPTGPSRRQKSWVATAAVATGLALGAAGLAGAATGSSGTAATSSDSSTAAATAPAAPSANGTAPDPSTMKQGPGETLLTGDTAAKVEAAALKAVPGATIIRVETDSSGATYEAHMKKADGTFVTVLFDASYNVTSTESGFGGGPQGQAPPAGAPASGTSSSTSTSN